MPRKTPKPAPPVPDAAPVDINDLTSRFKDYPGIALVNRQLHAPGASLTLPVLLNDESPDSCTNSDHQARMKRGAIACHLCKRPVRKWYVRFINATVEGRWSQIRGRGYVPVLIGELMDINDVSDLVKQADNYVRRGDTGREVMVKMPLELWIALRRRAVEERRKRAGNLGALRQDLAEAAGAELGDEAGSAIFAGDIKVERWKEERATLGEEHAAAVEESHE